MTEIPMTEPTESKGLSKKAKSMVLGLFLLALSFYVGFIVVTALAR